MDVSRESRLPDKVAWTTLRSSQHRLLLEAQIAESPGYATSWGMRCK